MEPKRLQHVFFRQHNTTWLDHLVTVEDAINRNLQHNQLVSISQWEERDGEKVVLVWFYA